MRMQLPPAPRDPPSLPPTLIQTAISGTGPEARAALEALYRTYRAPMIAYIREWNHDRSWSTADAEELMHEFLAIRLDKRDLKGWDPKRARFRKYLLGALRNFLLKKVSGSKVHLHVSIDDVSWQLGHHLDPERIRQGKWARNCARELARRSFVRLRVQYESRSALFDALVPYLPKSALLSGRPPYEELSRRFEKTTGALKLDMFRMRERWGRIVREEVSQTVLEDEVDDELRWLIDALESGEHD